VIFYLKYPFQKKADIVSLEIEKLLQKGAIFLTFETDQFLFLAMRELVQDKKKSRAFYRQMHAVQFMSTAPSNSPCFSFLQ
jgi:hypothetical protein